MDLYELAGRFGLLAISILVLYFLSHRNQSETISPLYNIVGICTFSLCYIFTKMEIGVGIGFGLFAIFSVLRFRTKTFSINAVIFLFTSITLSIIDVMMPWGKFQLLSFFQIAIIGSYALSFFIYKDKAAGFKENCDFIIPYEGTFHKDKITMAIREQTDFKEFYYQIIAVNTVAKEATVKIYF